MLHRFLVTKNPTKPRLTLYLQIAEHWFGWHLLDTPSRNPADDTLTQEITAVDGAEFAAPGGAIIWDCGAWGAEEDPALSLQRGKLRFELRGYKMRGTWALGRNKGVWRGRGKAWRPSENWTLVKAHDDAASTRRPRQYDQHSVHSGLLIDDADGAERLASIDDLAKSLGAKKGRVAWAEQTIPFHEEEVAPFSDAEFVFEVRLSEIDVLAAQSRKRVHLVDADGRDLSSLFPELAPALMTPVLRTAIAVGEIVILDRFGRADEARLAERLVMEETTDIARAALEAPATLRLFDLLCVAGRDLRPLPLRARKQVLAALAPTVGPISGGQDIPEHGEQLFERAKTDLHPPYTIVARRADATHPAEYVSFLEERDPDAGTLTLSDGARARVRMSNLGKVFFPEAGFTKGDLLAYYESIGPAILPWLRDRAVVLKRFVDGIDGRGFFQHNAPGAKSSWLRTARIKMSKRPRDYFICENVESVLYLVNLATIPLHIWHSRVHSLERPDWCVVDIDRSKASLGDVIDVAHAVHDLCETAALPSFIKTSGGTGLHILIPLAGQLDFEQSRTLAALLARSVEERMPDRATTESTIERRGNRVYVDWMVNGRGRMLVSPYSVRARPGATVSTPLSWDEVTADLDPTTFNIMTVPERVRDIEDPWKDLLQIQPDILGALGRLA